MYYTYILKSLKDNKYYYGSCQNLTLRLQQHNSHKVKSTKSRIFF
ncbi:GIY-YIG nuclease family protein [Pseudopedobacter saltans]